MPRGENASTTTSAQRTRSNITSWLSGSVRSSARPRLLALRLLNRPDFSGSPSLPTKGASVRAVSIRCIDSTLITSAP